MKASVVVLVYNQEMYIAETLDHLLDQQCEFDYEVVIGEDGSTDGTRRICLDYQARHPGKIRLLLHNQNQGLVENRYQTLDICRGEYIALCDGDDYWCDRLKLKKQVEFLDCHPGYVLVYGGFRNLKMATGEMSEFVPRPVSDDMFEALMHRTGLPLTSTVCFRRNAYEKINTAEIRAQKFMMDDLPLFIALSREGQFHAMRECVAVYRTYQGSVSRPDTGTRRIEMEKSVCDAVIFFAQKYGYGGVAFGRRIMGNHHDKALKLLIRTGKHADAREYLTKLSRREFWRWKILRAWLVLRLSFLQPIVYGLDRGKSLAGQRRRANMRRGKLAEWGRDLR